MALQQQQQQQIRMQQLQQQQQQGLRQGMVVQQGGVIQVQQGMPTTSTATAAGFETRDGCAARGCDP